MTSCRVTAGLEEVTGRCTNIVGTSDTENNHDSSEHNSLEQQMRTSNNFCQL